MITCDQLIVPPLRELLARYGLKLLLEQDDNAPIPGSHWGEPEAGLIGTTVYVRADTPLHSVLHEAAHFICMDNQRRAQLHTDAGGDYDEENGVCYLQILLAHELGISIKDACADMDTWGYTFRLGSAHAWFTGDADDARAWLLRHGVITPQATPTWRCRGIKDQPRTSERLSQNTDHTRHSTVL
jgi:hypothetical protein